jgi:mono/diheme cytochrome c family protein
MSTRTWIVFIVGFALTLFLGACHPNPQPAGLTPIPTLAPAETLTLVPALQVPPEGGAPTTPVVGGPEDSALGAPLYFKNCSPCHGVEGQGVDAPPLRNNQYVQVGGDEDVFKTVAGGRSGTGMPAWQQSNGGPLTEEEIATVISYLHTLQGVQPVPTPTPVPPEPTETPLPPGAPTPEPARPSNPGEPGPAAALDGDVTRGKAEFGLYCAPCHGPEGMEGVGVPNPGSDDGVVPELNPIDPTIANSDPKVFAVNVDLFIEHGSVPEGPSPQIMMPPFGDSQMLSQQQIADLIVYVMALNGVDRAQQ